MSPEFVRQSTHYLFTGDLEGSDMANGVNHAKKIVIDEATSLADQLQNGGAGDTHLQGKAIGLMVKMITPLYEADFVTTQSCAAIRMECREEASKIHDKITTDVIEQCSKLSPIKTTKAVMKLGPLELQGTVVPIAAILLVLVLPTAAVTFIMGKSQGWW